MRLKRGYAFWTPERCDQLEQLLAAGKTDEEIAVIMNRTPSSILHQKQYQGFQTDKIVSRQEWLAPVRFPQFENITKAEARQITKNAPPCGRIMNESRRSLIGSAAALCADRGNVAG